MPAGCSGQSARVASQNPPTDLLNLPRRLYSLMENNLENTTTLIHFPSQPITLRVVSRTNSHNPEERLTLKHLLETRCSSLFKPFRPCWWLYSGHLQTVYNIARDFTRVDKIWYRRKLLRVADGGTVALDFAPLDDSQIDHDAPIIVVCHGLTGGSHEPYLRAILARACRPIEQGGLGYRGVVVTHRGCAGVPVTSPRLYTAGHTEDLTQALMYLSYHYPKSRLLGLGFSLGANIMTRYVSEAGDRSRLSSAVVLSCPWDMEKNGHGLVSTFAGKNMYARGMGWNMMRLVRRHEPSLRKFPDHPICKELPSVLALKFPTLPKFDDTFTRKVGGEAPTFPIPTVDEYYRWAASDKRVQDIRVPFLSINSADDPVVTSVPMDSKDNGSVVMVLTTMGGHLGWFSSGSKRWTTKPILEWLELMGNDVLFDDKPHLPLSVDNDGFIRGDDNQLGCTVEAKDDGPIDGTAGDQSLLRPS